MSREHLYKAKRVDWRKLPKEEWWVEGFYVQLPKPSLGATIIAGGDLCAEDVADYIIVNKSKQHSNFSNAYPLEVVECEQYEVDPETVCEYTGLTDKNSRKIFECDIIRKMVNVYKLGENAPCGERILIGSVIWDNSSLLYPGNWSLKSKDEHGNDATYTFDNKYEVISNIFDNPELLEGGEEE